MRLENAPILLTGAAGGIGSATARELNRAGARLLLTDVNEAALVQLADELRRHGGDPQVLAANITESTERDRLVSRAEALDVEALVNIAGINPFGWLEQQNPQELELLFRINVIAPVLLCRAIIPAFLRRGSGCIMNVGSAFGAIGYPGFAAYSASKFAIRGFSEALRRELSDTPVRVLYVAPRATQTRLITDRVRAMNAELKIAMDSPPTVARAIAESLRTERKETYLGRPERMFAKLNGLLPRLVDRAIAKQLPTVKRHATAAPRRSADVEPAL
jgi:short-subunit dehydrogenase